MEVEYRERERERNDGEDKGKEEGETEGEGGLDIASEEIMVPYEVVGARSI